MVAAIAIVLVVQERSMPIKEEKVVCNLEWGMSREEAKIAMAKQGYDDFEAIDIGEYTYLQYFMNRYQGIEGANCELTLVFNEDRLDDGIYYFRAYDDTPVYTSLDTINELQLMFAKRYEKCCKESISEEYHDEREPQDPDYSRYFVCEESLVFVCRVNEEMLTVEFENSNTEEMKAYIEALKVLDATDAPSPTGYYSKRGE